MILPTPRVFREGEDTSGAGATSPPGATTTTTAAPSGEQARVLQLSFAEKAFVAPAAPASAPDPIAEGVKAVLGLYDAPPELTASTQEVGTEVEPEGESATTAPPAQGAGPDNTAAVVAAVLAALDARGALPRPAAPAADPNEDPTLAFTRNRVVPAVEDAQKRLAAVEAELETRKRQDAVAARDAQIAANRQTCQRTAREMVAKMAGRLSVEEQAAMSRAVEKSVTRAFNGGEIDGPAALDRVTREEIAEAFAARKDASTRTAATLAGIRATAQEHTTQVSGAATSPPMTFAAMSRQMFGTEDINLAQFEEVKKALARTGTGR